MAGDRVLDFTHHLPNLSLNTSLTPVPNPLKFLPSKICPRVGSYPANARKLAARAAGIRSTSTQVKTWSVSSSRSATA